MAMIMRIWILLPLLLLGALLLGGCTQSNSPAPNASGPIVGNDRDAHGCIPSAGYEWCEAAQSCIRPWEQNCTAGMNAGASGSPASNSSSSAPSNPPSSDSLNPCAGVSSVGAHDYCFAALAQHESNVTYCERIYLMPQRDECLKSFLSNSSGSDFCAQFDSSANQDACYLRLAYAANSSALCVRVSDAAARASCQSALAPCSVESTPAAAARCNAFLKHDPALCSDDSCRFDFALQAHTITACLLIQDSALSQACQAVVQNNASACQSGNATSRSDYCYELAALALNDSRWCSYGQQGSPYRDDCYTRFAILTLNADGCKQPFLETSRDQCYLNYSDATDTPAVCDSILNSLNRVKCYIHTAKDNGDAAACNELSHSDRIICYNNVLTGSVPVRDAASCLAITAVESGIWTPKCLTALAVQQKDVSICAQITDAGYRSSCQAKLS